MIEPIEIVGLKSAFRVLEQIEPGTRKKFAKDARKILEPAVLEIRNSYPPVLLRGGTERVWHGGGSNKNNGRQIFPYSQAKARRGVKVAVNVASKKKSLIRIMQTDPAAIVAEFAGAKTRSPLAQSLSFRYGRPGRFAWPAIERKTKEVSANMKAATMDIMAKANRNLR